MNSPVRTLREHAAFAVVALCGLASACTAPRDPPIDDDPIIELRLVERDSKAGSERVELDGEVLLVQAEPVISDADLRSVNASPRGDELHLVLELSPAAEQRLDRLSGEHVGYRMAFFLGSRIRSAPVIASAIGSPLDAAVQVDGPEREAILERPRSRWPPDR